MVIFNSYVKLPEGIWHQCKRRCAGNPHCEWHVLDEIQEYPWFPFFLFAALENVNLKSFLINNGDCYNIDSTMTGFQPWHFRGVGQPPTSCMYNMCIWVNLITSSRRDVTEMIRWMFRGIFPTVGPTCQLFMLFSLRVSELWKNQPDINVNTN